MSKYTKIFIVAIILVILCYITYGYFNNNSESGENIEGVQEAFADEVNDIVQEDEIINVSDPVQQILNKLNEQGFNNIYERNDFITSKNAEYPYRLAADIDGLEDFISDDDMVLLEEYSSGIGKSQTAAYILENEPKYQEIINTAKDAKDEYLAEQARIAAAKRAAKATSSNSYYSGPSTGLTKRGGVNYHDGRRETYYSSRVLHHYRTNEWTVDDEGFYRDSEGRYVVAASDKSQGSTFEGSKGTCVVLDSGCAAGTTDYYVNW